MKKSWNEPKVEKLDVKATERKNRPQGGIKTKKGNKDKLKWTCIPKYQ